MIKLSRRAPLAIAVALLSLAVHASGCTSLLGDLPVGQAGDASSAADSGGGDATNEDSNPGQDVTGGETAADVAPDDGGGGPDGQADSDSGEGGTSCGPSNCSSGCCDTTGHCVTFTMQGNGNCGRGGLACSACASGDSCSNGTCSCGGTMCNGCCGTGNACISPTTTMQCGANGAACTACASDQTCDAQGQCVCDPTKCAGCCDATTQHCVTTTTNTQCGANGSTCTSCGTNLECSGGQCVCDSNSCSMGCCVGGSTGTCELFGAQSGASCGQGGATCGTCPMGQTCDGAGNCVCNSSSCPHGCCSGGPTGTCVDWGSQSPTSCGTAGATCTGCTNGLCDTNNGTCACDSNTCASGCCVGGTTGTCEGSSGQSFTSCGTGGATCGACGTNESCTSGACTCGGSSGCAGGTSCCVNAGVGSCVTLTNDPNNCGWCGHSCQGGTCANGLCGTVTLGQTTYKGTSGPAGLTLGGANLYFSEYVGSANNGYIETCPTTGCPGTTPTATVVYTDVGNAGLGQIFYDSVMNALYWGDGNQGRFYGYNLTSNSVLFQGSDGVVAGVATDSSYVYLADFSGLAFANKTTGGGFAHISSTLGYSQGVALDSSGNIWVAARNNDIVTTCTLGGCGAQWTWTGGPDFIAVVGSSTYVATQNSGLYRCASATDCSQGNATQLTTESPANFSNDGTYAYFGYGGAVQRCSLSTGCATPQNVGQATGNVLWTAVDSTWVYWLTDAGEIQKVAK